MKEEHEDKLEKVLFLNWRRNDVRINLLFFTKLQKGNTGVGKIPAMWTILKFIHVEVTDENICLRMEEKIKLYPKSGSKLHVVFEKYFFFYNCVILLFSFTDIMIESVIMLQIMALSTLGLILWKVRSLSPGPIFPTSKNLTINWKCLGLNVTRQLTWRHNYAKTLNTVYQN